MLVAASHWHDDHIKGLSETVRHCRSAKLAFCSIFTNHEFLGLLKHYDDQPVDKIDRGGTELLKCLENAQPNSQQIQVVQENSIIFVSEAGTLAHGFRVELLALTPSSDLYLEFLRRLRSSVDESIGEAKTRLVEPDRNAISVAMLFSIGNQSVLLGADLEDNNDPDRGWNAVIRNRREQKNLAHIHKIPHHGSANAHNPQVWETLLHPKTWSVVTPWRKGGGVLPKEEDKARIKELSEEAHLTSTKKHIPLRRRYDRETLKHLKKSGADLMIAGFSDGYVRYRWKPPAKTPSISLFNGAVKL